MVDRERLELLMACAAALELKPEVVDKGLVSIEVQGRKRYIFHKVSNPNNLMSSWLAENKYASRIVLGKNNLPNIPYCLPSDMNEAKQFLVEHKRIIVKPVKGRQSRDIHLVRTADQLDALDITDCIFEKFIKGQEVRLLVVNGEVKAIHLKVYEGDVNDPKTVQRVSLEREAWDTGLMELAVKAAEAVGLIFTAVDFLVDEDNQTYILEINSAPGLARFLEPDKGPSVDIMNMYLKQLITNYSV